MSKASSLVLIDAAAVLFCATPAFTTTHGAVQTEVHTIIIHTVSGPFCAGNRVVYSGAPGDAARWKRFFDFHPFLGIHYIVDRSGTVLSSTPENQMANHALGHNQGTIGIELVHNGDGEEPFGGEQMSALIDLIRSIRTRHNIDIENIKSHAEVDVRTFQCGGKTVKARMDPGSNFPWSELRAGLQRNESE
jgi:N-acetyl-anhydromuramyl-L-alanine amidase AmpD